MGEDSKSTVVLGASDHKGQLATVHPLVVAPLSPLLKITERRVPKHSSTHAGITTSKVTHSHSQNQQTERKMGEPEKSNDISHTLIVSSQWIANLQFLDETTADACRVIAWKVRRLVGCKLDAVLEWCADFYRQLNAPPILTPAGNPYVQQRWQPLHLFLTPDGRLKSVVER